ncbi:MAG: putative nickel-responsive regulator [Deltaproteobacteria bacterium]|jgi:metal-responsive CopG/Arc/MetJ family transcriptional regulator|nr:putative nickel-responsive regulator [Deltaproteobacteria bacterium]
MSSTKVAITIDQKLLNKLDYLVKTNIFSNRSKAIQEAVADKLANIDRSRLARECAKLDVAFEQELAEEEMHFELESWPEY